MNLDRFGFKARCKRINCWVYAALHDVSKSCEMRWKCEKGTLTFSPAWVKLDTLCQCTGIHEHFQKLIDAGATKVGDIIGYGN